MELTKEQKSKFRAVAAACGLSIGSRDIAVTRDTIGDFAEFQGDPKDLGHGFFFWAETRSPKGKALVQDAGEFRAAIFIPS